MQPINATARSAWTAASLNANPSWIYELDDRARRDLTQGTADWERANDIMGAAQSQTRRN